MVTAAIYARISLDRHDGEGVARQLADGQALAAAKGWQAVEYVDNDLSAYKKARRPAWDRLLADLRAGEVGAVVAYHPDRLYRRLVDLEDLIDSIEAAGALVATVKAGDIDLSTATGRMTARIIAAVARHESERTGERVSRAKQERAAQGRPAGGGRRCFGFTLQRTEIVAEEAEWIRRVADALVAGSSWNEQVRTLAAAGVTTTGGKPWTGATLRRTMTLPLMAGLRTYKGEIVGASVTPAILERDVWDTLRLRVAAAKRGRPPSDQYLLTGILRCGRCDGRMYGIHTRTSAVAYQCPASSGGCGLSIVQRRLEEHVEVTVQSWLTDPDLTAHFAGHAAAEAPTPAALVDEADQLEQRRSTITARWAAGEVTDEEYETARSVFTRRLDEIDARSSRAPRRLRIAGADLGALADAWPEMTVGEKRSIVTELAVTPFVVGPGQARGRRLAPVDRVAIKRSWT